MSRIHNCCCSAFAKWTRKGSRNCRSCSIFRKCRKMPKAGDMIYDRYWHESDQSLTVAAFQDPTQHQEYRYYAKLSGCPGQKTTYTRIQSLVKVMMMMMMARQCEDRRLHQSPLRKTGGKWALASTVKPQRFDVRRRCSKSQQMSGLEMKATSWRLLASW